MTIRRQLLHGTFWSAFGTYGSAGITFLVTLLLARVLTPADFGLIAAVVAFTAFLEAVVDVGIGSSIVQRQDVTRDELASLFWAVFAGACAIYGILVASGPALGRLLDIPLLPRVLPVAGLTAVLYGLLTVPLALVRQRRQFKEVAVVQTIASALGGVVALSLAMSGYGYRALVVQTVLTVAARTTGMWIVARWWPSFTFRMSDLAHATAYSGPLVAAVVINVWARSLDAIFIARLAGITALGHYNLAVRLAGAPMILITAGVRPQLHPLFAAIRDEPDRVREAFRETVAMTALASFSLAALMFVVAEPLVLTLWGPAWAPTIGIMHAFALLTALQPVSSLSTSLFLTGDKTALMLRIVIVNATALIIAMALGAVWGGAPGVAWAYSVVYALFAMPRSMLTAYVRLFGGKPSELLRSLGLPTVFAAAIAAAGIATNTTLLNLALPPLTRLVATAATACVAMLVVVRLFAWELMLRAVRSIRESDRDTARP